jgi:DNA-binding winged helix-turn-helix (wHTH) protein
MRRLLLIDDRTASVQSAARDARIVAKAVITRSEGAGNHTLPFGTTLICPVLFICGSVWGDRRIERRVVYGDSTEMERALLLGADDYLCEPWSPLELLLRVRQQESLHATNLGNVIDVGGATIVVSSQQAALWRALVERKGRAVSRDVLRGVLCGDVTATNDSTTNPTDRRASRSVDMHIARLRRTLGEGGKCIETVRGRGYRLREELIKNSNLNVDKSWKT